MIGTALKFVKVASKAATVAWAVKTGYDVYQKGKKAYKVYDAVKQTRNKIRKLGK